MTRLCTALLAGFLVAGCTLGPVWSRRLEGRVIDARTREPVAGAVVTSVYSVALMGTHGGSFELDGGTTRSDADGYFALPGRPVVTFMPLGVSQPNPRVRAFHPAYGLGSAYLPNDGARWYVDRFDLEIALDVENHDLDALLRPEPPR